VVLPEYPHLDQPSIRRKGAAAPLSDGSAHGRAWHRDAIPPARLR
jgi:hypothetical protein